MVQTGDAALFPLTPTQVATLKGKGIPVEYAQPKEGSVVLMTAQCVIAHNSDPDLAQKLAAYLLSPEAQAKVLEQANFIPTNAKTQASGDAAQTLKTIGEYMKTAVTVDWDSINENRPRWNERWNKTIER